MAVTGFFAGSFDPPTLGHVDIVERALRLVDTVVVGVGRHADKPGWLPVEQRLELLSAVLPAGVAVTAFDGLAVAAAREVGASVLVRGVRGPEDGSAEVQMAWANRRLDPELETLLLPASMETIHISSRLVREVHRSGGDIGLFVPEAVSRALARRE